MINRMVPNSALELLGRRESCTKFEIYYLLNHHETVDDFPGETVSSGRLSSGSPVDLKHPMLVLFFAASSTTIHNSEPSCDCFHQSRWKKSRLWSERHDNQVQKRSIVHPTGSLQHFLAHSVSKRHPKVLPTICVVQRPSRAIN